MDASSHGARRLISLPAITPCGVLRIASLALLAAMALWGCGSTDTPVGPGPDPAPSLTRISSVDTNGVRIELYAERAIETGVTPLHLAVVDPATGRRLRGASLSFVPWMDMPGAPHTAPFEAPGAADSLGLHPCMAVFTMIGSWKLVVDYSTGDGRSGTAVLPFSVTGSRRVKAVFGSDLEVYIVALGEPRRPDIGLNPADVYIYHQKRLTEYPAVTDATVAMEPTMPAMNHGSPANVDPVHVSSGRYRGTVNFTMLGDWRVSFSITRPDGSSENSVITITTFFDLTL